MMHEISTAEIRVSDVGNRVVVIDDGGNAYSGIVPIIFNSARSPARDTNHPSGEHLSPDNYPFKL